jgi:hypothetical protein
MNPANLQLEGLLLAVESLQRLLIDKGFIGAGEVDHALHKAEASLTGEERMQELSPSNRDAAVFPLRFLRQALTRDEAPGFAEIAKRVGETKPLYNDQA